jgi:hypothetical protein
MRSKHCRHLTEPMLRVFIRECIVDSFSSLKVSSFP